MFLFLFSLFASLAHALDYSQAFNLHDANYLTFHKDQYAHRRHFPTVSQIQCDGPYCQDLPNTIECRNTFIDTRDNVHWTCTGNVPQHIRLVSADPECEAFSNAPDNKWMWKGSCSLVVTLEYVRSDVQFWSSVGLICFIVLVFVVFCQPVQNRTGTPYPTPIIIPTTTYTTIPEAPPAPVWSMPPPSSNLRYRPKSTTQTVSTTTRILQSPKRPSAPPLPFNSVPVLPTNVSNGVTRVLKTSEPSAPSQSVQGTTRVLKVPETNSNGLN